MTIGLVCDACDALSPLTASSCQACGATLGILPSRNSAARPAAASTTTRRCPTCDAEVALHFRFCGACGKPIGDGPTSTSSSSPELRKQSGSAKTMFFGAMQAARAKLILIKGDGLDGVSYVLSATEHVAGRQEGAILFAEDPLLSPRHANFLYREGKLFVRDEGSANGVFVRIIKPHRLLPNGLFLVGEQLLRVEAVPQDSVPVPDSEGTYFYGSPKRPSKLALVQMLAGGHRGMIFRAREDTLSIGREGNDVNFPEDPFISGHHASVSAVDTADGPRFQLTDLGSKNGTFVRIHQEAPLVHGDYVFIGQQLLRVEVT